ncbi:hypothetical protein KSAC_27870 [Komagataeibacter saccharivorans]|uniref:hypothetical protein n=1 Tax=Komagataeibacter saccharivorans TaxID=265959 RepID=UPI00104DC8F9|nr:hypothetical protein [Komagataeibacter saccharivorans]QBL94967.1 hypothetical protein KSAC_27870 [Komagataeibacter saccharivorans]
MADCYLQLRKITFKGPKAGVSLGFTSGVNVVCGASDTGKSFLAESIDFMLGGSNLREIPEWSRYGEIELDCHVTDGENWRWRRSISGGNFKLIDLNNPESSEKNLNQNHSHGKIDNLSGFLLEKLGLLDKRILKSKTKGTTQSLSFRNLARLIIVQEGEVQQRGSPFWSGQYTTKTAELATIKLLLTGVDDSAVVSSMDPGPDNTKQIALIEELLTDLATEIADLDEDQEALSSQLDRLEVSIGALNESLNAAQRQLDNLVIQRRKAFEEQHAICGRRDEISELLARFNLLQKHYFVDIDRLTAIHESGSMFAYVEAIPCPLCGAAPESQHMDETCDGDVEAIVAAAAAEIEKIERLKNELTATVEDLRREDGDLKILLLSKDTAYQELNKTIQESVAPEVSGTRTSFAELVEERASVQRAIDLFARREKLEARRHTLIDESNTGVEEIELTSGIPESVSHSFSKKISSILEAWNFPGECLVYFDKQTADFVIDGKPRGSRGKGLRAITHAAVTIALLEYCQENGLSHPGFVVIDSPLLAYFKPEGDDDLVLRGTDLKEKFYEYLVQHHSAESQVIVIENLHPPTEIQPCLSMTVFTGNPKDGRYGFL